MGEAKMGACTLESGTGASEKEELVDTFLTAVIAAKCSLPGPVKLTPLLHTDFYLFLKLL